MNSTAKTQRPWKTESELMARLAATQNRNTSVDIMTFAGFCDTREELEAYVMAKEQVAA